MQVDCAGLFTYQRRSRNRVSALLAKDRVDQALLTFVPLALVGYAIGVLVSAYMLYCVMMLADDWNYYWYHLGYTLHEKEAGLHEESAYRWDKRMHLAFAEAGLCFALSSSFIALGMWKTTPPPQPIPAITTPATK